MVMVIVRVTVQVIVIVAAIDIVSNSRKAVVGQLKAWY